MNTYTKTLIAEIKRKAKADNPDAQEVLHIHPRAYCVAKPADWCAVFVTCPCDSAPQIGHPRNKFQLIQDKSAAEVQVGDWCWLAYISTATCGTPKVIKIL